MLTKTMLLICIINFTSYAQKYEKWEDSLDLGRDFFYGGDIKFLPMTYGPYYILLDTNSVPFDSLVAADSLFHIAVEEIGKLPMAGWLDSNERCSKISIPESLFSIFSKSQQDSLKNIVSKDDTLNIADSLFCRKHLDYEGCAYPDYTIYWRRIACSLHISSEKSPSGEYIILMNGTAYRIATRADGSKVLRRFQ